jgi:hypothetical protein
MVAAIASNALLSRGRPPWRREDVITRTDA